METNSNLNTQMVIQLEALLFWKGEPLSKKKIETILSCTSEELATAITELSTNLSNRGLCLMDHGGELELRTAPEMSDMIQALTKDELMKDLGKAGLETLSIILYQGPIKRSEIDYIRGVNSSFIIRNLLVRGLVERITEKDGGGRGFSYTPTMELLAHLGVSKKEELPEFDTVNKDIKAFKTGEVDKSEEN